MLKVPHCRPATDPRFSKVTLEYSLGLNLVYTNFGVLILVMRDSEIVAVQFRDQNARLCAEASWNLRQQSVMVGILLFVNIQSPVAGQIKALMLGVVTHVLDRNKSALLATWPLPAGYKLNVAMAFDEGDNRLFVVTRNTGKLIVLNSDSGKVISNVPAVSMVDDMSYDAQHKRLYLAGDGALDVFEQKDPDHYALLAKIPGGFRAKTGILVPELNRYYLAVPHHKNKDAEVRVYEIQP